MFFDKPVVVEADDLATAHRITEHVEEKMEGNFGPVRRTIHPEPKDSVEKGIN